ncbi:bifunctional methylenetetrahydrofolate dehydrogenase/methenyltetrahydrofolate cyclohydrolase, partial [Candidatus Kaiserbacteria bacterium]
MNTIADGRAIAQKIKDTLSDTSTDGVQLDVIVVGDNKVTATFVSAKKRFAEQVGISFVQHTVSESSSTEEVV